MSSSRELKNFFLQKSMSAIEHKAWKFSLHKVHGSEQRNFPCTKGGRSAERNATTKLHISALRLRCCSSEKSFSVHYPKETMRKLEFTSRRWWRRRRRKNPFSVLSPVLFIDRAAFLIMNGWLRVEWARLRFGLMRDWGNCGKFSCTRLIKLEIVFASI